jgi:NADP-dependent 3-hydroxy acid dehydrogenase YdfG
MSQDMPFHSIKLEAMTEMHDRNYKAVWAAMQAAITLFETQNDAKIQHPKGGYAIV